MLKKLLLLCAGALTALSALAQPVISTQNLNATGACTANSCAVVDMRNSGSASVQITGTYTASGGLSLQRSNNSTNWETVSANAFVPVGGTGVATITSASVGTWKLSGCVGLRFCRVVALGAVTGSATLEVYQANASDGGTTSVSGGAGDASASNQVTGNNSLDSIDTKTPGFGTAGTPSANVISVQGVASGTPQPVSGTVAATQSGNWSVRAQDGAGNAITSATRGAERAMSVQIVDSGGTQITSFGGSGGTASNFGSAVPSTGTAAGMSDGTNMRPPRVFDTDSGGGTEYTTGVSLRVTASGGSAEAAAGPGAASASTLRTVSASDDPIIAAINAANTQLPAALGQTTMANSLSVTVASNQSAVSVAPAGSVAHDAAASSVNPVLSGGYASAAAPSEVSADGDSVRAWHLRNGAAVVQPSYAGTLADSNTGNASGGTQRVVTATNQPAIPLHGHGAIGAAIPANATAVGARSGANMVNVAQGSATAPINVSTATTTQLVALSGSTQTYVTGLAVIAGGTGNITLVYGTGTNCGTGTTSLSGAIPLIANAGFTLGSGLGPVVVVPAGQALCVTTSAAVQMSGFVTYTQF